MSAFTQKIILTVLAVGIYALCAWPPMSGVAEALKVLSGLIVGAAWVTKPGDGALVEAGKEAQRKSAFPPNPNSLIVFVAPLVSHAVAMSIAFGALVACTDPPALNDARAEAARMRSSLAEVKGALDFAEPAIEMLCGIRDVPACGPTRDTLRVLQAAHKVASQGVDTAESLGIAAGSREVSNVLEQARALGATVLALGSEVANAVDREPSGTPVGPLLESPAPGAPTPPQAAAAPVTSP